MSLHGCPASSVNRALLRRLATAIAGAIDPGMPGARAVELLGGSFYPKVVGPEAYVLVQRRVAARRWFRLGHCASDCAGEFFCELGERGLSLIHI
eukprot:12796188-Alexandrium_andersonii.AAC.1